MKIKFVISLLLTMSLFGMSIATNAIDTKKNLIPNYLILKNCIDQELTTKIIEIDSMFEQAALMETGDPLQNLLRLIDKNKLSDSEVITLISKSKVHNLCGASANMALSTYYAALHIEGLKKGTKNTFSKSSSKYKYKAFSIYRHYASKGSINAIKLLCISDDWDGWVVGAIDKPTQEACLKALYSKNINLSAIEKAKIFTAVYNSYTINFQKFLSKRAEICFDFVNEISAMSYSNYRLHRLNRDMCNAEFISYGEKLFSNNNYPEALKYLSAFDQSLNKTGIPQFELGYIYQTGIGVIQNYKLAIDWYKKASVQGNNPSAQYNLGIMYMKGLGIPRDYTIAHALFNLASANGIKNAAKIRDMLANKMTNTQIENAQNLAKKGVK